MPDIDLGPVVGKPGKDASAASVQRWLGQFTYSEQDALVNAQGNVDIATGGALSIDSVQLGAGDIVLLTKQTNKKENGLYAVQTGSWVRMSGYETGDGAAFDFQYIVITSGEKDAGKIYTIGTEQYTIGQTEIEFVETAFSIAAIPGKAVIRDREGEFEGGGSIIPVLTAVIVTSIPDKSAYETGDTFNAAGLVVQGVFSDASTQQIMPENPPGPGISGYILSDPDMSSVGQKTVVVTYQGLTASFVIVVSDPPPPPVVTGIELTELPTKLEYEKYESLDLSGILVKATYSDGAKITLSHDASGTSGYKNSSPDMSTIGIKAVTISYKPGETNFTQTFDIEVTLGEDYDGVVDNVTETNRSLLTVLGASTVKQAWTMLHERINADGLCNYHGLGLGDYLDLTAGLPAPLNIAWDASYINLRIYIVGFNIYKGSNGNTKNHIVWGFKNIPETRQMNSSNVNAGGYPATELKTHIDSDFLSSLISALGADYLYNVARLVSTKGGQTVMSAKLWPPNEKEVFGSATYGDDPDPQITIPLYAKDASYRIKNWNGSAYYWWEGSPISDSPPYFCTVNTNGTAYNYTASNTSGVAPCFCEI